MRSTLIARFTSVAIHQFLGITLPTPTNDIGDANIKIFAKGAQTTKLPEYLKHCSQANSLMHSF
jgi:hypothetical protein